MRELEPCTVRELLTAEDHWRAVKAQARRLGYKNLEAFQEAQFAADRAFYHDDDMAVKLMQKIEREVTKTLQARDAASKPRRSKWADLQPVALRLAGGIQDARPGLSRSRLADLVLDLLAADYPELPDKRTILRWVQIS